MNIVSGVQFCGNLTKILSFPNPKEKNLRKDLFTYTEERLRVAEHAFWNMCLSLNGVKTLLPSVGTNLSHVVKCVRKIMRVWNGLNANSLTSKLTESLRT